ncbi:ExbD/TolR family protein [Neptunomonas concharum]|uniref:Biopolymer transporter ExbD n=1 Tax=Neptunomonas concharum TaxID=1031538 RepID=A0A5P1RDM7_9GAMM|nr:biopolymer transporter ExbD [Neptunomonas concharum]QEQ97713.1 biopolymer transporter ExbD [Neptunomonas concharum]
MKPLMINLPDSGKSNSSDDNLIPLINIVFLMLIFFMVAGQIQRTDSIKIEPPQSVSSLSPEDEKVSLIIEHDGSIHLEDTAVELDQLANLLALQISHQPTSSLLIKTDATLPAEKLYEILKYVRAAGFQKISLATRLRVEAS